MVKEVHHRVKNNFQIVSSLLELQTKGIEDEKALELANEGKTFTDLLFRILVGAPRRFIAFRPADTGSMSACQQNYRIKWKFWY